MSTETTGLDERMIDATNNIEVPKSNQQRYSLSNPTLEDINKLDSVRRLSWFNRNFRGMKTGSLRGVIIMWIRMTLGIGILTLPFYIKQYGGLTGIFALLLAASANYLAYSFIFEASFFTGKKNYPDLIEALLGKTILRVFRITFILDLTSTIMIYCIVSWNLCEYIMYFFRIGEEHWDEWIIDKDKLLFDEMHPTIFMIRGFFFYGIFLLTIPLFLKKSLESLQKVTICYLISLFTLVGIILVELPFFKSAYKHEDTGFRLTKQPQYNGIECFFGLCISFYVQPFIFSLRGELLLPSLKRTKKISRISISIEFLIFLVLGFCGYYALGDTYTPNLMILRKPYPGKSEVSKMIFRCAITLFFVLNVLGLAMYNPSLRDYLSKYVRMSNEKFKYILLSLLPFFLICTVAFVYPYVIGVTNLFGITVYNFNGYIIPLAMKIALLRKKSAGAMKIILTSFVLIGFVTAGIAGLVFRIFDLTVF